MKYRKLIMKSATPIAILALLSQASASEVQVSLEHQALLKLFEDKGMAQTVASTPVKIKLHQISRQWL